MKKLLAVSLLSLTLIFSSAPVASAVTLQELQAQLAALMAQIAAMQGQTNPGNIYGTTTGGIVTPSSCFTFTRNLKVGDGKTSYDEPMVRALQNDLESEGFSVSDEEKKGGSIFGDSTAAAVVAFQQKYASDILAPNGLTIGNGFVGVSTRVKLNQLYGCNNNTQSTVQTSAGARIKLISYSKQGTPNQATTITWDATENTEASLDFICPSGAIQFFVIEDGRTVGCDKGGLQHYSNQSGNSISFVPSGNAQSITVPFTLTILKNGYSTGEHSTIYVPFTPSLATTGGTVQTGIPKITFTTRTPNLTSGSQAQFDWSTTDATFCSFAGSPPVSNLATSFNSLKDTLNASNFSLGPINQTTQFDLTCKGPGGFNSKSVTVNVGVQTVSAGSSKPVLTATPNYACGGNVSLSWTSVSGASLYKVYRNSGLVASTANSSWTDTNLTPGANYTYQVMPVIGGVDSYSFSNQATTASSGSCSATPTATSAPTVTLTASPTTVNSGQPTTITWSSTNAVSCGAGSGWGGYKALSGTEVVYPTQASNYYYITCVGQTNPQAANANVTVTMAGGTQQAPTVMSVYPTSAPVGSVVTVAGSNFDQATFIGFDGIYGTAVQPTSITLNSTISLSFVVPSSLSIGNHTLAVAQKAGPWNLSNPVSLNVTSSSQTSNSSLNPYSDPSYSKTSSSSLTGSEKTVTYQYPDSPCGSLMTDFIAPGSVSVGRGPVYNMATQQCGSGTLPNDSSFRVYSCRNTSSLNGVSGIATFAFQCSVPGQSSNALDAIRASLQKISDQLKAL